MNGGVQLRDHGASSRRFAARLDEPPAEEQKSIHWDQGEAIFASPCWEYTGQGRQARLTQGIRFGIACVPTQSDL